MMPFIKIKSVMPRTILRRLGVYASWRGKRRFYYSVEGGKGLSLNDRWHDLSTIADLRASDTLLDLGCAEGLITMEAAKHVHHATGIEIVPYRLDKAKEIAKNRQLKNVTFKTGSIFDLPPDKYDVILLMAVYGKEKYVGPKEVCNVINITKRALYISLKNHEADDVRRVCEYNGFSFKPHPTVISKEDLIAECKRISS